MSEEAVVTEETKPEKSGRAGKVGKMLLIVVLAAGSSAGGGIVSFMLMKRTLNLNAQQRAAEVMEHNERERIVEIQEKIEVYFPEPKLVDVMFTEFVIQL